MSLPIPATAEHLTAQWLTSALQRSFPGIEVSGVDISPIGTGQMASSLRVRFDHAGAESTDVEPPESVVVKMASTDPNSRQAGARGAYLKEVRFYQHFADGLPVATPACHWSAIDSETNDFAIVLQDMSSARQGDQITGCSVEHVESAARNIAGLHAPHWGDGDLFDHQWLTAPRSEQAQAVAELKMLLGAVTPGFIDRYDSRLSADHRSLLTWFAETVDVWIGQDTGPIGLLHGDHRLDNLLFDDSDGAKPVTVVDWQTVAVRNPLADISYLLGTSVEAPVRRAIEHDVVASYHQELTALGVQDFDLDACFESYRTQTPHALLLTVLGSMLTVQTDRGDDMFMAMLSRSAQQMADLDVR